MMAKSTLTVTYEVALSPETMALLTEIRDRLPAVRAEAPAAPQKGSALAAAKRAALSAVLESLDGWIEGARENHGAMEHRDEPRGEECWRQFDPREIRSMVNDAAREVGIEEFPHPKFPKEDAV